MFRRKNRNKAAGSGQDNSGCCGSSVGYPSRFAFGSLPPSGGAAIPLHLTKGFCHYLFALPRQVTARVIIFCICQEVFVMVAKASDTVWGTGRRKTSIARVRLVPGNGSITVNGKPIEVYFPTDRRRKHALRPFELAGAADRYDIHANITGGGETGQAGALLMGIARALEKVEPELRPELKRHGLLTRDSRMVERKKYGLHKARRGCQFSKR
jgi:small subunit ribosomal protein S9